MYIKKRNRYTSKTLNIFAWYYASIFSSQLVAIVVLWLMAFLCCVSVSDILIMILLMIMVKLRHLLCTCVTFTEPRERVGIACSKWAQYMSYSTLIFFFYFNFVMCTKCIHFLCYQPSLNWKKKINIGIWEIQIWSSLILLQVNLCFWN